MKENKNIERLFQEKFKDFEEIPPNAAWENIASKLEKKKDRKRGIPFWFKASGIAASLFLTFFLILNNNKNKEVDIIENSIVIQEKNDIQEKDNLDDISNEKPVVDSKPDGNVVESSFEKGSNIVESTLENTSNSTNESLNNKERILKSKSKSDGVVVNNDNISILKKNIDNKASKYKEQNKSYSDKINSELVNNDKRNESSFESYIVDEIVKNDENIVLANSNKKSESSNLKSTTNSLDELNQNVFINEEELAEKTKLVDNTRNESLKEENKLDEKRTLTFNEISTNTPYTSNKTDEKKGKNILSIPMDKDSTIVIAEVKTDVNALEQLLKEKEEGRNAVEKEEEKRGKWVVSSNAAPVYFNSVSEGSPIDEQFIDNAKSYSTSLSYGLGIQYALSEKVSLRTGINSIALSYNTNNVYYSNTLDQARSTSLNVETNSNAQFLVLKNNSTVQIQASLFASEVSGLSDVKEASLNQEMGYIEVPLEVSYKLIDKKFGIELIGGMSTLFLSKNTVSLVSNQSEMNIGKASNLNNIHFSSNVGLGFKYSFWKSFNANLQPMFKYQINTFNTNSGNFKPYFVGLYSGISFSF